jgi:hypothetical protein
MPKFRNLLESRSIQESEAAITAEAMLDYLQLSNEPVVHSSATWHPDCGFSGEHLNG